MGNKKVTLNHLVRVCVFFFGGGLVLHEDCRGGRPFFELTFNRLNKIY